ESALLKGETTRKGRMCRKTPPFFPSGEETLRENSTARSSLLHRDRRLHLGRVVCGPSRGRVHHPPDERGTGAPSGVQPCPHGPGLHGARGSCLSLRGLGGRGGRHLRP